MPAFLHPTGPQIASQARFNRRDRAIGRMERILNEDNVAVQKLHPRGVRLELTGGILWADLKKKHKDAVRVILDGHRHFRAYVRDNLPAESLARRNFELLVFKVIRRTIEALANRELKILHQDRKNTLKDIEATCTDFEGISIKGFVTKDGLPMKRDKSFLYMVRLFFKDEESASKAVMLGEQDYLELMQARGKKDEKHACSIPVLGAVGARS